ncbi:FAD-dependent oxidoreductase [soil metagenome]
MSTSTQPLWQSRLLLPATGRQLLDNVHCDVCIIGGGIAGLSVAYHLARQRKSVLVLEAQSEIGAGVTGCTSAHLSCILDDRFAHLESIRGIENVRKAYLSHAEAIDTIEAIQKREGIECEFQRVNGHLFAPDSNGDDILLEEARICEAARIRFDWTDHLPWKSPRRNPVLLFPDQAQFHPHKYMVGLAGALRMLGVDLYTGCRVDHVESGLQPRVMTENGRMVTAEAVVLATNTPINSGITLNARIASYSTYVIAAELPITDVSPGLFWDTEDPYHYVRFANGDNDESLVIIGGEDHKTGQEQNPAECYDRLESWARERFPRFGPIRHRWDGQVFETLDGLALIGPDASAGKNMYVVTGDSGMGLTHGTMAGSIISDAIIGHENPYAELYDPARLPIAATGTFLRENANTAGQYLDWVTGGDDRDPFMLTAGEGMVLRRGLVKLAVCRIEGEEGLMVLSATCPHFGGIVHWNNADQTWDCPCHGSRFAADGRVLHGPATTNMKAATIVSDNPAELKLA